jgi:CRISPR-associated protein Csb1
MDLIDPVGKVSSLQAPHRIADAILRDSLLEGTPFRQTDVGRQVDRVSIQNATPLFELCPTALLFGMWDSTGPKGGLGAKFERAMVAEIVGIDVVYGVKTSSRIDPLGIQRNAGPLYATANGSGIGWTLDENNARRQKAKPIPLGKDGRPSEANHGNVTPTLSPQDRDTGDYLAGGVTIAYAEQTIVLSLPALRRLKFPVNGHMWEATADQRKRDIAGRTVVAALGLLAAALADEAGLDLRSRCLLWPENDLMWELLDRKGSTEFAVPADQAIEIFNDAVKAAKEMGLPWREEPLVLSPSDQLVKLVAKSQCLAQQAGDAKGGD